MHLDTIETITSRKGGVLAVDKPSGISSHTVVNWARKVFGIRKVGHTGTLDPLASGLLMLLVGREFTKKQQLYLLQDKEYLVTAQLGKETDTYDSMGRVLAKCDWQQVAHISDQEIEDALKSFVGEGEQRVPAFSAVKKSGEKLYDLALAGVLQTADLPIRTVTMHEIQIKNISTDVSLRERYVTFTVSCGSGTYVRSLVHDFGRLLGCGAVVTGLRRIAIGTVRISDVSVCPVVPQKYSLLNK